MPYIDDWSIEKQEIILASNISAFISMFLKEDFQVPQNIEFLICSNLLDNIYKWRANSSLVSWFLYSYISASMYAVIDKLKDVILKKINNQNDIHMQILNELNNSDLLNTFIAIHKNSKAKAKDIVKCDECLVGTNGLKKHCNKIYEKFATYKIYSDKECKGKELSAVKNLAEKIPEEKIKKFLSCNVK